VILSQFLQEKNASEVMTELNNITTPQDNKTLSETVLMTSLHTLQRLVDFEKAKENSTSSEMNFTSVYKIASNLLDSANKATWGEIDSKVGIACFPWRILPENIGGSVQPAFQNPHPICDRNLQFSLPYQYDATKNSIPYLRPDPY